ncbi:FtsX-like permease family protein [Candidatus Woesearchaeota archaeon]|nr:FtsX-like permease family protein [Candidatus Woesearchaeota archaeon]
MIEHFRLALINLKEKRLRSWLTLIGIFIGIAAVVSLIGLGDGLKLAITSQFGISSTEVIAVQAGGITAAGPPGTAVTISLTQDDVDAIQELSTVDFAIPRILESGKLEFDDRVVFGMSMSIPEGEQRKFAYQILEVEPLEGRLLKDGDSKKVVLGYNFLANNVGLGKPVHAGDNVLINDVKFEVVGITAKKGSFIFDNIVHMNEEPLKDLFGVGDEVDLIGVKIKDKGFMDEAQEQIERLMRKRRDVKEGEEDFSVDTPQSALATINSVLTGVQLFIVIIAAISILVGGLGIVNTMLTAVLERRPQIGTMKAVGAKNSDIFKLFFIESGLLGLVGGAIGTIVGTIISYFGTKGITDFFGSTAQPQISFMLISSALLGSFVIGSVAGIIPAMRAAKQNPVDALRG